MMGRPRGRPTKLTPGAVDRICEAVNLGASWRLACLAGGVSYPCLRNWINRGEAEVRRLAENPHAKIRTKELPFVDFLYRIRSAEGEGLVTNLRNVRQAADEGDWKASWVVLQARYPETFGASQRFSFTGAGGGPIQLQAVDPRQALIEHVGDHDQLAAAEVISDGELAQRIAGELAAPSVARVPALPPGGANGRGNGTY
jgi:hypothetical protein